MSHYIKKTMANFCCTRQAISIFNLLVILLITNISTVQGSDQAPVSVGASASVFVPGEGFTVVTPLDLDADLVSVEELQRFQQAIDDNERLNFDFEEELRRQNARDAKINDAGIDFFLFSILAAVRSDEDESDIARVLVRKAAAFNEPFLYFDFTATNETNLEVDLNFQMTQLLDPFQITGETVAQAFLQVDLIDKNNDGFAKVAPSFGRSGILSGQGILESGPLTVGIPSFLEHGGEINGETDGFVTFDTGVISGPTMEESNPLTEMNATAGFTISPGDEVRIRAIINIAEDPLLLLPPEVIIGAVDDFLAVPEPSTFLLTVISISGIVIFRRFRHS